MFKNFTPDKPFVVYPNPATDKLTIEFHNNPDGADIELLDLTGKRLMITRIPANKDHLNLDVGWLKGGMYLLKVTPSGKNPVICKAIVERNN